MADEPYEIEIVLFETEQRDIPWKCLGCGEEHRVRGMGFIFRGDWLDLLEELAKRRHETVEHFLIHLIWLESRLRKGALKEKADSVLFGHSHDRVRPNFRDNHEH